jgi:hypothetical protein
MAAPARAGMAPRLTRRDALLALGTLAGTPVVPGAPSAVGNAALLERVTALRPNQSLLLGRARVVGDFNATAAQFGLDRTGPQARDYCRKMVWAPERGSALFAGANHRLPHRLNDVWEFDLAAFAWRLLYAPDLPRTYGGLGDKSDVLFRDGVLVTRRGGPAVIGHTWAGVTYDVVQRCLLFMATWPISILPLISEVGGDPGSLYAGPPLWRFHPHTGKWSLWNTAQPWPRAPVASLLEYVPELEGSLWHQNNWRLAATWLIDSRHGRWSAIADARLSPGFETQAPGSEMVGYHDPERRLVIAQRHRDTFHFDTDKRQWQRTIEGTGPDGNDIHTTFCHHPATAAGLLVDFRDGSVQAYDADAARWRKLQPDGDPMPQGGRVLAYVDRLRNVLVVVDDTEVWVYRPG